jgi:hypothetical protein
MQNLPVTYRTRPAKMAFLVLGSLVFVSLGLWLLPREPNIARACIIFFGLCALVGLVNLLPNSSYLTLTEKGFLLVSLFRKHFVEWSNVQSFVPVRIQRRSMVGWNYSSEYRGSKRLRSVNSALAGGGSGLARHLWHACRATCGFDESIARYICKGWESGALGISSSRTGVRAGPRAEQYSAAKQPERPFQTKDSQGGDR